MYTASTHHPAPVPANASQDHAWPVWRAAAVALSAAAMVSLHLPAAHADPLPEDRGRMTPGFVWGYNNQGALGSGTVARAKTPIAVALPAGTVKLAGGVGFTIALTKAGTVFAWGDSRWGQLGNGSVARRLTAVQVKIPGRVTRIDAAGDHAIAATSDGRVYAWGRNTFGQLGDGTTTNRSTPVRARIPGGNRITAVAAGATHTLAVTNRGQVLAWGRNNRGQLDGAPGVSRSTPTSVALPGSPRVSAVSSGESHTVALTTTGRVVTWGTAAGTPEAAARPTDQAAGPRTMSLPGGRATAIDTGTGHTVVLTSSARLYTWGDNSHGQLGDGTTTDRITLTPIPTLGTVRSISTAGHHSIAIDRRGHVWTWGDNNFGQSAGGGVTGSKLPTILGALRGAHVSSVAAAEYHTAVTVTRGPLTSLRLDPARKTVKPGQHLSYTVTGVDVFGNPVATFTGQARLTMAGGVCRGASCWSSKPGAHEVTASVGARIAHAQLTVKSHKASGVVPAPEGSGSGTSLAPPGPATAARPDLPDRAPGAKNSAIDLLATSAGPGGPLPAILVGLLCLTAATLRYRRRVAARPAPDQEEH